MDNIEDIKKSIADKKNIIGNAVELPKLHGEDIVSLKAYNTKLESLIPKKKSHPVSTHDTVTYIHYGAPEVEELTKENALLREANVTHRETKKNLENELKICSESNATSKAELEKCNNDLEECRKDLEDCRKSLVKYNELKGLYGESKDLNAEYDVEAVENAVAYKELEDMYDELKKSSNPDNDEVAKLKSRIALFLSYIKEMNERTQMNLVRDGDGERFDRSKTTKGETELSDEEKIVAMERQEMTVRTRNEIVKLRNRNTVIDELLKKKRYNLF
jgi:septal ring factor EnvC (AmiA/AmiB activator)